MALFENIEFDGFIDTNPSIKINYGLKTIVHKSELPKIKAVYALEYCGVIIYVGKTKNLKNRITEHRQRKAFNRVWYFDCEHDFDEWVVEVEKSLIKYFKPFQNKTFNVGKEEPSGFSEGYILRYRYVQEVFNAQQSISSILCSEEHGFYRENTTKT